MPPHRSETFCQEWFRRVWNEGDARAIDQLMAPDAVAHGLGDTPIHGPDEFRRFHGSFVRAFDGIHVEVVREVAEGDMVSCWCEASMRRRDDPKLLGFSGAAMIRLRDRRMVEAWNSWDFLRLLEEMGHLPKDALAGAVTGQLHAYGR
ncbi:MAG TPA: nuclear transport factor 2 family protein [Gemmatimonadales bacterium]|nr:nuclear transport factor 2 family protein [Gemmatimonadales bacterium]